MHNPTYIERLPFPLRFCAVAVILLHWLLFNAKSDAIATQVEEGET